MRVEQLVSAAQGDKDKTVEATRKHCLDKDETDRKRGVYKTK